MLYPVVAKKEYHRGRCSKTKIHRNDTQWYVKPENRRTAPENRRTAPENRRTGKGGLTKGGLTKS